MKVEYHFFSNPSPRNNQRPAGNPFSNTYTSAAVTLHFRSLSSDHHMMSLNIDMKMIDSSLELFGFAHFVHELLDFLRAAMQ